MIVLVANLGSTSFKYKLFRMPEEHVLASGSADRIGQGGSAWKLQAGEDEREGTADLADHGAAIALHLQQLADLGVSEASELEAIGFKAVHGGPISGAVIVDEKVLDTMRQFTPLAPAHNPAYIAAMQSFAEQLPSVRQVAAFETAFHSTVPKCRQVYATPYEWYEQYGIRRYGFHGASHRYISERMAQLRPDVDRIVSLHLGGSCSLSAIDAGDSVANSLGTTPQTGVFHNNRVGDFDPFAMLMLREKGLDDQAIFQKLGKEGGLLGISGVSADLRDVEEAANDGNKRAKLAFDAFVDSCRHYLGAYLAHLGGADAIVFTGGIGQHSRTVRKAICANMDYAGIVLDRYRNEDADGDEETRIDDREQSKVEIWVLPTNEELIVARQTVTAIEKAG